MSADFRRRERVRARGFTLVEILMVILVITILIGILLVAIGRTRRSAAVSRVRFDLQAVSQALRAFKDDHKGYPGMVPVPPQFPPSATPYPMNLALAYGLVGPRNDDGEEGPGFRLSATGGRVFRPYLDMDRFKMVDEKGFDGQQNTNDDTGAYQLLDSNGQMIHYYPRRRTLAQANPQTGTVLEPTGNISASDRGLYAENDSIIFFNETDAAKRYPLPLRLLRFMLGDDNNNNKIDGNETLIFSDDFILASPGPDGVFLEESKVSRDAVTGSDDVFNFTR